jgi:hypothetical protein
LRLLSDGSIEQAPDFLSVAERPARTGNPWNRRFSAWASAAMATAGPTAALIANKIVAQAVAERQARLDRDAASAKAWLQVISDDTCGPVVPWTPDLFDAAGQPDPATTPEQRLALLVADPAAPTTKRHQAADVLARFHAMIAPQTPPVPTLRMLGLLMLVP